MPLLPKKNRGLRPSPSGGPSAGTSPHSTGASAHDSLDHYQDPHSILANIRTAESSGQGSSPRISEDSNASSGFVRDTNLLSPHGGNVRHTMDFATGSSTLTHSGSSFGDGSSDIVSLNTSKPVDSAAETATAMPSPLGVDRQRLYQTSPSPSFVNKQSGSLGDAEIAPARGQPAGAAVTNSLRRTDSSLTAEAGMLKPAADLMAHASCTKYGLLSKRGGGKMSKGYRKRFFVLCGTHLFYYKSQKERTPQGVVANVGTYVVLEGKKCEFQLQPTSSGGRSYFLLAKSEEERREWIAALPTAADAVSARIEEKIKGNYLISPEDISWDEAAPTLGKGASGVVRRGTWLGTQGVAVKLLNNIPEFIDADEYREFFTEIDTLSQLRHPCIVSMFGYAKKEGYLALVQEFVGGGDLSHAIHMPESVWIPLSPHLKLLLLQSTARGMVYLHTKGVTHRDLKPGNILVENLLQGKVKVCDFGLSGVQNGLGEGRIIYGSPAYAAPELPQPDHTELVDVFSFGVIMWELWLRRKPWTECDYSSEISDRIAAGTRPNLEWVVVSLMEKSSKDAENTKALQALISDCWETSAESRPNFQNVFQALERLLSAVPDEQDRLMQDVKVSTGATGELSVTPASAAAAAVSTARDVLLREAFRGEPTVPFSAWEAAALPLFYAPAAEGMYVDTLNSFAESPKQEMRTELKCIKELIADKNGVMQVDVTTKLVSWFLPLRRDTETDDLTGWSTSQMIELLDIPSFVGYASANEAKEWLVKRRVGSFLFRFSSQVGYYVLSATWARGEVGHWRIATTIERGEPIFTMNSRTYSSLQEIIEQHAPGALAIVAQESGSGQGKVDCFLESPVTKHEVLADKEDVYM